MARKKKSMIGVDPLAWLDKEKEDNETTAAAEPEVEPEAQPAVEPEKPKVTSHKIEVLGVKVDEVAITKGFELSIEHVDEIVKAFYRSLFDQYPDVKPLFNNFDEDAQANKLIQAIRLLIDNLHDEPALRNALTELGRRHQTYGALPDHYPVVIELLLGSFKEKIGRHWTKAITKAWSDLLTAASETMCSAYEVDMEQQETEAAAEDAEKLEAADSLHLHSVQDISKSQALKNDMLSLINDHDQISIDASDVERIDGSAMQLLCALFVYGKEHNLMINWINPTEALVDAAETLGMKDILELNE